MSKRIEENIKYPHAPKQPYYIDDQGFRRDPNRAGHPRLCNGTSRTTGLPCCNIARANGKCRNHGGNSTGPKTAEGRRKVREANKLHKLKTGEYQNIWYDTLREEERNMIHLIPKDAKALIEEEIKFTTIRERRLLQQINNLEDEHLAGLGEETLQEVYKTMPVIDKYDERVVELDEYGEEVVQTETVKTSTLAINGDIRKLLLSYHDALTRVQANLAKLIDLKHKLDEGTVEEQDGSLGLLASILDKARKSRQKQIERVDKANS